MRAIVQERYGPPEALRLREIEQPAVGDDKVLVRVRAASVHPDVWHVVTGRPYALRLMGSGLRRPKWAVPGTDLAGVVTAVGKDVKRFKPGDEVFGESLRGFAWRNGGTFAEYVAAPEDVLAPKPMNVTFEQAATVPTAGYIALLNYPSDWVRPGMRVLVNGAAGGVGAIVVQLAKGDGAHVTGVDQAAKLDLVRALGADQVIDYTRDDFTRSGERYDLIIDIPGNHSFAEIRRALAPDSKYVLIGHDHFGREGRRMLGSLPRFARLVVLSAFVRNLRSGNAARMGKLEAIVLLQSYLAAGTLTPVVERAFPLEEAGNAISYLASGEAHGRIVVTM